MSREPNRNVYVGHRYVPKIMGEWDKTQDYEGLSIVLYQGGSYTSKKRVPVGIDILNDEFWAITGNYNAQVDYYRQETERVAEDLLLKADQSYTDTELGKKANQTYVDTELGKKSDQSYTDTELGKKADKSYTDTELGKKANQTYVNTELGSKNELPEHLRESIRSVLNIYQNDLKDRGVNITLPPYNAKGNGITDDTDIIHQVINDLPVNGVMIIPYGKVFRTRGITISKEIKILGGGEIKFINNIPELPSVLVCNSKVDMYDITIDGNVDNLSEDYEMNGVGLENNGNRSIFNDVSFNNTKYNGFRNTGNNVSVVNCYSENAGYAGFNNSGGDFFNLIDSEAYNYKFKGFSHNLTSLKINIDGFKAVTDSLENGVDGILVDPNGRSVEHLTLKNIYVNGLNRSNCIKFIDTKNVVMENVQALSNNTLYGLHCYGDMGNVIIRNSLIVGRTDLQAINKLKVSDVIFDATRHIGNTYVVQTPFRYDAVISDILDISILGGMTHAVIINAERLKHTNIKNIHYKGEHNLIAILKSGAISPTDKQIILEDYILENDNEVASSGSMIYIHDVLKTSKGVTSRRPLKPKTGQEYFDTDLGYPIYWNGSSWVNAIGDEVV